MKLRKKAILPSQITLVDDKTVMKTDRCSNLVELNLIEDIIKFFEDGHDDSVVSAHSFQNLGNNKYSYKMDLLFPLEDEEESFIDHVTEEMSHKGINIFSNDILKSYQYDILIKYMQKHTALTAFLKRVLMEGRYLDLHAGNVMKNSNGDFKLIDIESFVYVGFGKPTAYEWLSKK